VNGRRVLSGLVRLAAVALAAWIFAGAPARANEVVADLSNHLIAINSSFTGTSVVLFGATDGPGDIVAVVRGPERDLTVWRKGKIAGIWANAESVEFANVPSFYNLAASRPIEEGVPPSAAALYRIGVGNLKFQPKSAVSPERLAVFTDALIREQRRAGLFPNRVEQISFLGERLFRASLAFPANVPTGTYLVEVFLIRNRDVVGAQTTPLIVSKVGMDAAVSDFATGEAAAYGAIAVLAAVMAGWLASLPFRTL
jgi:uncharacterized protein (TIGR02186 family)